MTQYVRNLLKPYRRQLLPVYWKLRNYPFPLYWGKELLRNYYGWQSVLNPMSALGISRLLDSIDLPSFKKSDTLFVLGSGTSINRLSEKAWATIESSDSLGLSHSVMLDFVPTYYVTEPPPVEEIGGQDFSALLHNIRLKATAYEGRPLIMQDVNSFINHAAWTYTIQQFPDILRSWIYLPQQFDIPARSVAEFNRSLIYLARTGLIKPGRLSPLFKRRASMSLIVLFGLACGYRNIVLCGVDLNNSKYFYSEDRIYYERMGLQVPPERVTGTIHMTNDPRYGGITIDLVLRCLYNILLEPNDCHLYVASDSSALYPTFPKFF